MRPFSVAADAVDLNKRRICVVCVSVSSAGSILMAETKAQRRQTDLRLGPSTPQRQSSTSKRQTANSERDRRLIVFSSFFFLIFFCACVCPFLQIATVSPDVADVANTNRLPPPKKKIEENQGNEKEENEANKRERNDARLLSLHSQGRDDQQSSRVCRVGGTLESTVCQRLFRSGSSLFIGFHGIAVNSFFPSGSLILADP